MAIASTAAAHSAHEFIQDKAPPARRALWLRLFDAIERANMRRAEREMARYLNLGGVGANFTDESEREVERWRSRSASCACPSSPGPLSASGWRAPDARSSRSAAWA